MRSNNVSSTVLTLQELTEFDIILCFDCEYTCREGSMQTNWEDPKHPPELIEIGLAAFTSPPSQLISTYSSYVRPIVQPVLSTYCKRLLDLSQITIDHAPEWRTVSQDVKQFIKKFHGESLISCCWGDDKRLLHENTVRNNTSDPFLNVPHANLMELCGRALGLKQRPLHREVVRKHLSLAPASGRHKALDDAMDLTVLLEAVEHTS